MPATSVQHFNATVCQQFHDCHITLPPTYPCSLGLSLMIRPKPHNVRTLTPLPPPLTCPVTA
eukprot:6601351-Pyramimonas_sp.AAC.1